MVFQSTIILTTSPERADLIFLPFAVGLAQSAPFTAENDARDAVPTFSLIATQTPI
jgi:hypothetical protein